jgi:hypothetical protein
MRYLLIFASVLITGSYAFAADQVKKYEVWITGDVLVQDGQLMFRCDKEVQGNTTGSLVLLGAIRDGAKVLLPMYAKAAEQHKKLRLYGVLVPDEAKSRKKNAPSIVFLTWKAHLPNDPDELPPNQKMIVGPNDYVKGYKVKVEKGPR